MAESKARQQKAAEKRRSPNKSPESVSIHQGQEEVLPSSSNHRGASGELSQIRKSVTNGERKRRSRGHVKKSVHNNSSSLSIPPPLHGPVGESRGSVLDNREDRSNTSKNSRLSVLSHSRWCATPGGNSTPESIATEKRRAISVLKRRRRVAATSLAESVPEPPIRNRRFSNKSSVDCVGRSRKSIVVETMRNMIEALRNACVCTSRTLSETCIRDNGQCWGQHEPTPGTTTRHYRGQGQGHSPVASVPSTLKANSLYEELTLGAPPTRPTFWQLLCFTWSPPSLGFPIGRQPTVKPSPRESSPSIARNSLYESVFNENMPTLLTPQQQYDQTQAGGTQNLTTQFKRLTQMPATDTFEVSKSSENMPKNRYQDIYCYDTTRVKLSRDKNDPDTDYINANYVNGFRHKRGYICSQGPLENTCADFWQMIWQEMVVTVVMVTKLRENHRVKCHSYWPLREGERHNYEQFTVKCVRVKDTPAWVETTLQITDKKANQSRLLNHLAFLAWPDYGIPESYADFLDFLALMHKRQTFFTRALGTAWQGHPQGPPIVVHCSAGVGRSGTVLACDICMRMMDSIGLVNIQATIELIREQRAFSIQTVEQYIFTHMAILEYARSKGYVVEDTPAKLSGISS